MHMLIYICIMFVLCTYVHVCVNQCIARSKRAVGGATQKKAPYTRGGSIIICLLKEASETLYPNIVLIKVAMLTKSCMFNTERLLQRAKLYV